ncbi:MAG: Ig-like domain repeat protein [Terracidiphilus sp.]
MIRSSWAATLTFVVALLMAALPLSGAAQTNIGYVALGSSIASTSVTVAIPTSGAVSSVAVLTEGAPNLDFTLVSTGNTCTGTVNTSCSVNVKFKPTAAGTRNGAVVVYSSTAVLGTAYITGTGTGPQIIFTSPMPAPITITGGPADPEYGVAVDGAGNIYSVGDGNVYKSAPSINATTGQITYPSSTTIYSSAAPNAVAVDGAGNVFVTDFNQAVYLLSLLPGGSYANAVNLVTGCGGSITTGCISMPHGLTVDGAGNLYVTDTFVDAVYKLTLSSSGYSAPVAITAPGGGWVPQSVAVDGSGNVYVVDQNSTSYHVYKVAYSLGIYSAPVAIAGAGTDNYLGNPDGVAVTGGGIVYVADFDDGIDILTPSGSGYTESSINVIESGSSVEVYGVAADGGGNAYFIGNNELTGTAAVGVEPFAAAPVLSLGSVPVGSYNSRPVTVQNIGNAALNFSQISFPSNFPELSGVNGDCSLTVPVPIGGNCPLTASFAPTVAMLSDTQPLTGSLTIDVNALPATQTIPLSGTAIQATAAVTLNTPTDPSTLGTSVIFSSTVTGAHGIVAPTGTVAFKSGGTTISGCSAAPLTSGVATCATSALPLGANIITATYSGDAVYLAPPNPPSLTETILTSLEAMPPAEGTNLGSATASSPATGSVTFTFSSAVTLSAINVLTGGAPGLDFALTSPQGANACAINTPYAAAATCTVYVTFTPNFAGPRYGAVILLDNGGNEASIEYLAATGNAAQDIFLPGYFSNALNGAANFSNPKGIAVDGSGNVYVADPNNQRINVIPLSHGSYSAMAPISGSFSFDTPVSVAVDGAGNLFVADPSYNNGTPGVYLLALQSGGGYFQIPLGSGWLSPASVTVDGAGIVFVADAGIEFSSNSAFVAELTPSKSGYTQTAIASSLTNDFGIAVDAADNLYLAVSENYFARTPGSVVKLTKTGSNYIPSTLGDTWYDPVAVAVDGNGNVYVTDDGGDIGNGSVGELTKQSNGSYLQSTLFTSICYTEGQCSLPFLGGFSPEGIALDGGGNLYLTEYDSRSAFKLDVADPPEGANQLQFAETAIGWTSTDSPRAITVENFGNQSLNFTALSYPTDFPELTPNPSGACTSSAQLAANGSCTLSIDFSPITPPAQSLTEAVSLTTNTISATGAQTIDVAGYEDAPTAQMTSLTASPSPSWVGNSVTITATVTIPSGQTPVLTGQVEFLFNGSDISGCSTVTLTVTANIGTASCTTSALPAGNDEITATYTGNNPATGINVYELVTVNAPPTSNFGDTNIGSANVGSTMSGNVVTITFDSSATLGGIEVLTEGAPNLDFTSTQSCTQSSQPTLRSSAKPMDTSSVPACACGNSYTATQSCTVNVSFAPTFAGPRYGAVVLTTGAGGSIVGTGYLQGNGVGAQTVFAVPIYVESNECCAVPGAVKSPKSALAPAPMPGFILDDEQLAWLPGFQSSISTGFEGSWDTPYGIAVDGANNLYIADGSNQIVVKESYSKNATTGVISYTATSINPPSVDEGSWGDPDGVAVDGAGNVYIADAGNGNVVLETLQPNGTYVASTIGTGWVEPAGIAVDGSGNVYVADAGVIGNDNGGVIIEKPTGGTYLQSYLPSEFNCPGGVAVDGAGNVFVADPCNDGYDVSMFTLQSNGNYIQSWIGGDMWNAAMGIAVDDNDNVYVADPDMGEVVLETLSDGNYIPTQIGQFYSPFGLALTPAGNLLVTDNGINWDNGGGGCDGNAEGCDAKHGHGIIPAAKTAGKSRPASVRPASVRPASILNGGTTSSSSTPSVYFLDFADPPQIGFATTGYGSTSSDSPQTVIVDDFGNATLDFYSVTGTPFYPADFPEFPGNPDDCAAGMAIVADSACTLTIDFTPSAPNFTGAPLLLKENVAIVTNAWNSAPQVGENEFKQLLSVSGTELSTVATPTFLPISGTTFSAPLTVHIYDTTEGAAIYYTIGSATPTTGSTLYNSATGITISNSATINAIAVLAGDTTSAEASASYIQNGAPDFSITMQTPAALTVIPGKSAVFNLTVAQFISGGGDTAVHAGQATPLSEGPIFTNPVVLSYTSVPALPSGWTVVFSQSPVPAGSGSTPVTMTIQTSQTTASTKPSGALATRLAPFSLALLLLPFAGWLRKSGRRLCRMVALLLLLGAGAAAMAGVSGCGSNIGFFGMAPKTYTVTVNGTMGELSHNANTTVALTVE